MQGSFSLFTKNGKFFWITHLKFGKGVPPPPPLGKSPKFVLFFQKISLTNQFRVIIHDFPEKIKLHMVIEMIIYDLYIDVEYVLMYAENLGTIKNVWTNSLKIWDSADPPPTP